jgi:glycerol-3-phosphate dehydrogenase (NAD(P)+)
MVAEGVKTARSARDLARRMNIEMPIVEAVYSMLFEELDPRRAVEQLMLREPKAEHHG